MASKKWCCLRGSWSSNEIVPEAVGPYRVRQLILTRIISEIYLFSSCYQLV